MTTNDWATTWTDKIAYYFGGVGVFIGSTIDSMGSMSMLTLVSILSIVCTAVISGTCQIIKTINDKKYKCQKIKLLSALQSIEDFKESRELIKKMRSELKSDLHNELVEQEIAIKAKETLNAKKDY